MFIVSCCMFGWLKQTQQLELSYDTNIHNIRVKSPDVIHINLRSVIPFSEVLASLETSLSCRHILGNRHIVILESIDAINHQQQYALSKRLDKSVSSVFIGTAKSISRCSKNLLSRFSSCRIEKLSTTCVDRIFETFVNQTTYLGLLDPGECKELTRVCNYDMDLILYCMDFPNWKMITSTNVIEIFINDLLQYVRKMKKLSLILQRIRSTFYTLMKYDIPPAAICREVLQLILKKHKQSPHILSGMIETVATAEHNLLHASKPIFHYERMMLKYVTLVSK